LERSHPASDSLLKRVSAAAVFVPFIVLVIWAGGFLFALLVEVLIILGLSELWHVLEAGGLRPLRRTGYVLGTAVCAAAFLLAGSPLAVIAVFSGTVIVTAVIALAGRSSRLAAGLVPTLGGVLYVGWLFAFQIPLRISGGWLLPGTKQDPNLAGMAALLFGYAMVWTCDTGAYFVGRKWGRRKLVPGVSPGKTVEGAAGGFLLTAAAALLFRHFFLPGMHPGEAALIGAVIGAVCQAGDIFESALKRRGGVKDSSSLIPGHGGILDRFDGMLFAIPVLYYILLAGHAS
jgi:phosphatidate cytidylyltransferase